MPQNGFGTGFSEASFPSTNIGQNDIMSVVTAGIPKVVVIVAVYPPKIVISVTFTIVIERQAHDCLSDVCVIVWPPAMESSVCVTAGQENVFMPPSGLGGTVQVQGGLQFSVPPSDSHRPDEGWKKLTSGSGPFGHGLHVFGNAPDGSCESSGGIEFTVVVEKVGTGPVGRNTEVVPNGERDIETHIEVLPDGNKEKEILGGSGTHTEVVPDGDSIRGTETEVVPEGDMEKVIPGGSELCEEVVLVAVSLELTFGLVEETTGVPEVARVLPAED
jgi:hypothetical protein